MSSTSDILIVQERKDIAGSTGNQDITTTKLGGRTPKLVLFLMRRTTSGSFSIGLGATDGTTQFACCFCAEDNASSADTKQTLETNACFFLIDPDAGGQQIDAEASVVSMITDGVRINVSTAVGGAGELCPVFFFAGDDLEIEIGQFTADAAAASTNTLNFGGGINQWDALIGVRTGDSAGNISNNHSFCMGFLSRLGGDSTGVCLHMASDDGAAAAVCTSGQFDTEFLRVIDPVGTNAWSISRTGASDTSITFTKDENDYTASDVFSYVAIGMAGLGATAEMLDTPTSAAVDWDVTSVGLKPQAVFAVGGGITAANKNTTQSTQGNGTGYCGAFWDEVSGSINGSNILGTEQDEADPMNVHQGIGFNPMNAHTDSFSPVFSLADGPPSEFNSVGWTFDASDVTTANATARNFMYLAFGEPDPLLLFREDALKFVSQPLFRM